MAFQICSSSMAEYDEIDDAIDDQWSDFDFEIDGPKLFAYLPSGHILTALMPHYVKFLDHDVVYEFVRGRRYTYRHLLSNAIRLAAWLVRHCSCRSDPTQSSYEILQICADNSAAWLACMYGSQLAGLPYATASSQWAPAHLHEYVQRVAPTVFVLDTQSVSDAPHLLQTLMQTESVKHIILLPSDNDEYLVRVLQQQLQHATSNKKPVTTLSAILGQYSSVQDAMSYLTAMRASVYDGGSVEQRLCLLVPSIGSVDKAYNTVSVTHASNIGRWMQREIALESDPVYNPKNPYVILSRPMTYFCSVSQHTRGYCHSAHMLTSVIIPTTHFCRETFARAVEYCRPTILLSSSTVLQQAFLDTEFTANYNMRSLYTIILAFSPLGSKLEQRLCALNHWVTILRVYGTAETGWVLSSHWPILQYPDEAPRKSGSLGKAMPEGTIELKLMEFSYDAEERKIIHSGRKVTWAHRYGELWMRAKTPAAAGSSCMFSGYYRQPEETAKRVTPDGWFKTGDVMYVDEDDWYWYVDRVENLMWVPSEPDAKTWHCFAPLEMEEALLVQTVVEVEDAAVMNAACGRAQDTDTKIVAVVVPRDKSVIGDGVREGVLADKLINFYNGSARKKSTEIEQDFLHNRNSST